MQEGLLSSPLQRVYFADKPDFFIDDFRTMKLYLSADPGNDMNQIYCAFNPIDENHWIKTELIDKKNFDVEEIVSTWRDNVQNLHHQVIKYIQDLIKQDENFNRIYNLGQWGKLDNIIYRRRNARRPIVFPFAKGLFCRQT